MIKYSIPFWDLRWVIKLKRFFGANEGDSHFDSMTFLLKISFLARLTAYVWSIVTQKLKYLHFVYPGFRKILTKLNFVERKTITAKRIINWNSVLLTGSNQQSLWGYNKLWDSQVENNDQLHILQHTSYPSMPLTGYVYRSFKRSSMLWTCYSVLFLFFLGEVYGLL